MFNTGNCSVPLVASIDGNGNNGNGFGGDGWGWIWIILISQFLEDGVMVSASVVTVGQIHRDYKDLQRVQTSMRDLH